MMRYFRNTLGNSRQGFTMIELLVVIAIIGILSSIVMMAIDSSRAKGRDGGRKAQIQEILKGLELYYTSTGEYPLDGTPGDSATGDTLTNIDASFISTEYFKRLPDEADRYYYCVSASQKSVLLAINTEEDEGGSEYCKVTRGMGNGADGFGCTAWETANAGDFCSSRF